MTQDLLVAIAQLALAIVVLIVTLLFVRLLAHRTAERNVRVLQRYIDLQVERRLQHTYDRLASALDSDREEGGE